MEQGFQFGRKVSSFYLARPWWQQAAFPKELKVVASITAAGFPSLMDIPSVLDILEHEKEQEIKEERKA